jgi:hypothetical protein
MQIRGTSPLLHRRPRFRAMARARNLLILEATTTFPWTIPTLFPNRGIHRRGIPLLLARGNLPWTYRTLIRITS